MFSRSDKLPLGLHNTVKKSQTFIPEHIMNIKYEDLKSLKPYEKELLIDSIRKTLIENNKTIDGKILQNIIDEIDNIIIKGISKKIQYTKS
jgi:hypothetical protein